MKWPDFFGRRARAQAKEYGRLLVLEINAHQVTANQVDRQHETNLRLIAQLREMDQGTFQISQVAPDWARIRPIFVKMQAAAEKRMQTENGRIKNLMIGEIVSAYNEPTIKTVLTHDDQLKRLK